MTLSSIPWIEITSTAIALAAIVVSVRTMRDNQRHMRLSVRPWLTGHYDLRSDSALVVELENRGLGPAILKEWVFWSEESSEKRVTTGLSSELQKYIAEHLPDPQLPFTYSSKKRCSLLKVGEKWRIFELDSAKVGDPQAMIAARGALLLTNPVRLPLRRRVLGDRYLYTT